VYHSYSYSLTSDATSPPYMLESIFLPTFYVGGMYLVVATLVACQTLLSIWPTWHSVIFSPTFAKVWLLIYSHIL
jgi:hypothetical protein